MSKFEYPGFTYLPQHSHKPLDKKCHDVAPGIYTFVGYSSSNFSVISSQNGYILVDAGDSLSGTAEALTEISRLVPGTLQAIILTHSHPDHRSGVAAFLEGQGEELPIWGHADFGAEQAGFKGLERISALRGGKHFGAGIPDELYTPNSILPRIPGKGPGPLASPNRFASGEVTAQEIDGVKLELHAVPGETTDHLLVWLPEQKVLFSGDHIYRSFPNLSPIRGSGYRDVARWGAAVRRLLDFGAEAVVFGHNEPVKGEEIHPMLSKYAEAIEYVYKETLKGMDAGLTPDELAASIQLPPHLRGEPYLGEYYGALAWAVRSIFAALLGWFDGNASNIVPLAPLEEAERIAKLAGGVDKLVAAADEAFQDEDYRWAAKLADYLIRLDEEERAKAIKADALEALSKIVLPISAKNYLLRSALDLKSSSS